MVTGANGTGGGVGCYASCNLPGDVLTRLGGGVVLQWRSRRQRVARFIHLVLTALSLVSTAAFANPVPPLDCGCGDCPRPDEACGIVSLADFAELHDIPVTPEDREALLAIYQAQPMSFRDIQLELSNLGIRTQALSLSYDDLVALDRPAICHLAAREQTHFVVVESARPTWVRIIADGGDVLRES